MRILALAGLLVLASGCAGSGAPADPPEDDGGGRTSVPGSDQGDGGDEEVLMFETGLALAGGPEEAVFDVDVPAGLSSTFARQVPAVNTLAAGFEVELEGCGADGFPFPGPYGGNVPHDFDLCDEPAEGPHALVVRSGGGYVDGRLELWGRAPAQDETALRHEPRRS